MQNVFGKAITDQYLQAMPQFAGRQITALDRARVANEKKCADSKDVDAHRYADGLKLKHGTGASTLCLVYNATGNDMSFVDCKNWYGRIGADAQCPNLKNGQWGVFLHVETTSARSMGAAVYRGKNGNGEKDCDYMMAWSTLSGANSVWVEAREPNHFKDAAWAFISDKLNETRLNYPDRIWEGCSSIISIGSDTIPKVEATFTLEDATN